MKKVTFVLFLTLLLVSSVAAIGLAADPSSLIVVRASDNSLWKATCSGTTCTGFTSFPGQFALQPTVYWDEDIQNFVVWGVDTTNHVWRATFDRFGTFANNWVTIPAATPSPVAAAGGGIVNTFSAINGGNLQVTTTSGGVVIKSLSPTAPFAGFYLVRTTGEVSNGAGAQNCIQLSNTNTYSGADDNSCSFNKTAIDYMQDIFTVERWFNASPGTNNFYALAKLTQGTAGVSYVWNTTLSAQYFPYSY